MNKELYTQDFKNSYTATQEVLTTYKYLCSVLDIIVNNDLENSKENIETLRQELSTLTAKTEQELDNLTKVVPTDIAIEYSNTLQAYLPTLYHDGLKLTGQVETIKNSIPNITPDINTSKVNIGAYDNSTLTYKTTPVLNYDILSKFGLYETKNAMNVPIISPIIDNNHCELFIENKSFDTENYTFTCDCLLISDTNFIILTNLIEKNFYCVLSLTPIIENYSCDITIKGGALFSYSSYHNQYISQPNNIGFVFNSYTGTEQIKIEPLRFIGDGIKFRLIVTFDTDVTNNTGDIPITSYYFGIQNTSIQYNLSNS